MTSPIKQWLNNLKIRFKTFRVNAKIRRYERRYKFCVRFNIKLGSTRAVWVTKRYAFKFPRIKSWDYFFKGLCANNKERICSKDAPTYFVPVLFSIPGLLVVMPSCKPFKRGNPLVRCFMADLWHPSNDYSPDDPRDEAFVARRYCEYIEENYAMYKGKPMCIDYGTFIRSDVNEQDFLREMKWLADKLDGKFEVIDEPEEVSDRVQVFGKSFQMDMDLLDIPVFTANVENKGRKLAHELDGQQAALEGQVLGTPRGGSGKSYHGLGDFPTTPRDISITGCTVQNPTEKDFLGPDWNKAGNAAL